LYGVAAATIIPLGRPLLAGSSDLPGGWARRAGTHGVAAIPSPKNRACTFRCTRLKPFFSPVLPDAVSPRVNADYELVGDRWGEATPDFLPDQIPLLTAITYDDYAIR